MTQDQPGGTTSQLAAILRSRIITGDLAPGAPVRDSAVAAELGVSRNTAREALSLLRHEGLLDHRNHQGFVVRTLTTADVRDIYAARIALEVRAVQDAAYAPDDALDELRRAVETTETAERAARWEDYASSSLEFHSALVRLLGSPLLDQFFDTILGRLRLAFHAAGDTSSFQRPWGPRDRAIWEHLADGDRAGAERLLRGYLHDSELTVLDMVRRQTTHR
ncbi:GntR family transcriptional regulator [Janibacter sp. CX7]|uniref:GntR family transcriptional regulator n=1 Tax=Janibacter sp. CX7 TaxID=2963431 RepID=UPI0020CD5D29|nr:GntR family transcriptional regulator [Janibacter sp. CX7]UTT67288.1 GntR family transcriptional regulator [Janibacter sp. CX7]